MTHEIIKTADYLLVVDDAKNHPIDANCRWIFVDGVIQRTTSIQPLHGVDIILAHIPLHNAPFLEGVSILPPLEQEDDVEKLAKKHLDEHHNNEDIAHPEMYDEYNSFIKGYNKAKEKYKWSNEDVVRIVEKSRETGLTAEYLILSFSQPKMPVGFVLSDKYSTFAEKLKYGKYIWD